MDELENQPSTLGAVEEFRFTDESVFSDTNSYMREIDALLNGPDTINKSPQQLEQESRNLANNYITGRASNFMSKGMLDFSTAQDLSNRMDKGRYKDAIAGMASQIGGSEIEDPESLIEIRSKKNADYAGVLLQSESNQLALQQEDVGLISGGLMAAEAVLSPIGAQESIGAVMRVFPEMGVEYRTGLGSAIAYAADQIRNAETPEQARALTRRLIDEFDDSLGVFNNNIYQKKQILDSLRNQLSGEDGLGMELLDNTMTVLEATTIVGAATKAAKALGKVTVQSVLPRFNINLNPGSPADIAAYTTKGTNDLLNANTEALARMGTDEASVTGDLVLPKLADDLSANGRPYLFDQLTNQTNPLKSFEEGMRTTYGTRLNDLQIKPLKDGFEFTMRVGTRKGVGFKTEAAAKREMKALGQAGATIEKAENGQYFVKMSGTDYFGFDRLDKITDDDFRGGGWRKLFGKATYASTRLVQSSNVAATVSANVQNSLKSMIKPLDDLGASERNIVGDVLRQEDTLNKEFTAEQLFGMGFNGRMINAYKSVREMTGKVLALKNANLRSRLLAEGWRSTTMGDSTFMLRRLDDASQVRGQVYDITNGTYVGRNAADDANFDYFRVKGDDLDSQWARLPKGTRLDDLPTRLIGDVTGYLPRLYKSPFFIREVKNGVSRTSAKYTAESLNDAKSSVARLNDEAEEGVSYEWYRAGDMQGQVTAWDELEELSAQGLLYTNKRRKAPLTDYFLKDGDGNGIPAGLMSPSDSINALINSGARTAGINAWTVQATKMWEKSYGAKFGTFNLFKKPARMSGTTEAQFEAAERAHDFISMVNGTAKPQVEGLIQSTMQGIHDSLTNYGKIGRLVAGELGGRTSKAVNFSKSAAFFAYIGLNPIRALVMQMTMIPTYTGIQGGLRYMMNQKFSRDSLALAINPTTEEGFTQTAKLLGMNKDELKTMVEGYRRSGLEDMVDNHIFQIGTMFDSNVAKAGAVGEGFTNVLNLAKRAGFDAGVRMDKRSTYLFSLNRFREANKRMPTSQKEWDDVTGFAEQLSLNQNRSDTLAGQDGLVSVFTQFLSHQFKMAGRIMGLEAGFTVREKLGMGAASLLMYGAGGYGAYQAVSSAYSKATGEDLEETYPDVANALRDGMLGFTADKIIQAASDAADDKTDLATSATFAPANMGFLGITPDNLMLFIRDSARLSVSGVASQIISTLDAPILGLSQSVYNAAKFGAVVAGHSGIPTDEKGLIIASKALSSLPITNNLFKGIVGLEIGAKIDSRGRPDVEATKGELMAMLLTGTRSAKEEDMAISRELYYGKYSGMDQAGMSQVVQSAAEEYSQHVISMFNSVAAKKRTVPEIIEIMEGYNYIMKYGLSDVNRNAFQTIVLNNLEKSGIMKNEAFSDSIYRQMTQGTIVPDGNARFVIDKADMPAEKKEELLKTLERMGFKD